jgi:undecaprenyl-diphosphatase
MDLLTQTVLLGAVQGLTEFLPVSSSGHLVLLQHFLGFKGDNLLFDLLVHVATLLAVLVYFRRRIWSLLRSLVDNRASEDRRLVIYILVATVVTAFVGFVFKGFLEQLFYRPYTVAAALAVTGFVLFLGDRLSHGTLESPSFGVWRSAGVGLVQGAAIVPGISRSGSTVSAALLLGMERVEAGPFSFLIAIPAITGAFMLEARGIGSISISCWGPYIAGMLVAFLVGLVSIKVFLQAIAKRRLVWFALYCWAVSGLSLLLLFRGY